MVVDTNGAPDSGAAYALADVASERPPKKPAPVERVLSSAFAWGELAPLVFLGSTDGSLHCYLPAPGPLMAGLRWHTTYKKIFHSNAQFLDTWGIYATVMDAKLALYTLPLLSNPKLDGNAKTSGISARPGVVSLEETKGAVLLAAHEDAKVVCVLTKQQTLHVLDWTVNSALELRAHHELPALLTGHAQLLAALPVQRMVLMGESHALLVLKKGWCVLNLDSGRLVEVRTQDLDKLAELDAVSAVVALPSRHSRLRRHHVNDVFLAGKHRAVLVSLDEQGSSRDKDGDVYDEIVEATTAGQKLPNLADEHARVRVDSVLEYNVAPRNAWSHPPYLLLDLTDRVAVHNAGSMRVLQTLPVKSAVGASAVVPIASRQLKLSQSSAHQQHQQHQQLQWLGGDVTPCIVTASAAFALQVLRMKPLAHQLDHARTLHRLDDAVALCQLCPDECAVGDDEQRRIYTDYAFELFRGGHYGRAMAFFLESQARVFEIVTLFPRDLLPRKVVATQLASSSSAHSDHEPVKLQGDALDKSLLALTAFLHCKREASHSATAWSGSTRPPTTVPEADDEELELIDTMLVKCLVLSCESSSGSTARAEQMLQSVVNGPNACDVGEVEIFLRAHRRFEQLLDFYSARKLHRKALELLEDLERNTSSPSTSPHRIEDKKPTEPETKTPTPDFLVLTAEYLRKLGQNKAELVFEFSRRVIYIRPSLGLSIFTQRRVRDRKQDIEPASVLHHLKTCQISAAAGAEAIAADSEPTAELPLTSSRFLAIEYLTQTISHGKLRLGSRLHDEVTYLLLDAINSEVTNAQPPVRLTNRVSSQRGFVGRLRRKLLEFLESSGADYHPERMLSRTPSDMIDERAALLSKLGRHHEVLQLYALELKDPSLAEAYCNRCFEAKTADSGIYTTLLRLYLRPAALPGSSNPSASSEAVTAAVNVLNKFADRIDVPTVLELLPSDVPAASLAGFFRRVLELQVERFRNGQVQKQLAKMENFRVRQLLSTKRKASVTVWSSHCCQTCGKKLGVGTFVRLPTGALLHYSCQPSA